MDIEFDNFTPSYYGFIGFEEPYVDEKWKPYSSELGLELSVSQRTSGTLSYESTPAPLVTKAKSEETLMTMENSSVEKAHSKECLKFSRRLVKTMLKQFSAETSFTKSFLKVSAQVLNSILAVFGLEEIDTRSLVKDQMVIIKSVWEDLKNCLSYHKNKKICIVKAEYWANLFSLKIFTENTQEAIKKLDGSQLQQILVRYETIFNSFSQILFAVNQLMTLTFILRDGSEKGGQFMRSIETLENLLVLMIDGSLFEFYNHRSGKFASECCGRCKICQAKSVPWNFQTLLLEARRKLNSIVNIIPYICPSDIRFVDEQQLMYALTQIIRI